ncbi:HNH endonuclease, partial [Acinetobacter baumannii]
TTKYERDQKLRKQAILIHGYTCVACGFNFEEFYGDYAKGFIHIHHIEPLFSVGEKVVNPETDLVPLCANCHAVIHRKRDKTLTVDDLQKMIKRNVV